MDEKIREAVKKAIREVLDDEPSRQSIADRVINEVEAKLSPKHPKAGRICEVWDDPDPGTHYTRVATGDGGFINGGRMVDVWDRTTFDHYRVIPTAEDVLAAINENVVTIGETSGGVFAQVTRTIRTLIDTAMEG